MLNPYSTSESSSSIEEKEFKQLSPEIHNLIAQVAEHGDLHGFVEGKYERQYSDSTGTVFKKRFTASRGIDEDTPPENFAKCAEIGLPQTFNLREHLLAIKFTDGRNPDDIAQIAFEQGIGAGMVMGDKFVPLKPGNYKFGAVYGQPVLAPYSQLDNYDDLRLPPDRTDISAKEDVTFASFILTVQEQPGGNIFCTVQKIKYGSEMRDVVFLSENLSAKDEKALRQLSEDVYDLNIVPIKNEKVQKMDPDEADSLYYAAQEVSSLRKKGVNKAVATAERTGAVKTMTETLRDELGGRSNLKVELTLSGGEFTGFEIGSINKTELTRLCGLRRSEGDYARSRSGLRFGSTVDAGNVISADLEFDVRHKSSSGHVPETLQPESKPSYGTLAVTFKNPNGSVARMLNFDVLVEAHKLDDDRYSMSFKHIPQQGTPTLSADEVRSIVSCVAKSIRHQKIKR